MSNSESIFGEYESQSPAAPVSSKSRAIGLTALGLTAGSALALIVATAPFVAPALRRYCLPFVPATDEQLKNVFSALPKKGRLADIGSGDGRIVLMAAQNGFNATGYELNPWLVLYSKFRSHKLGLGKMAKFERKDLWKTDFKQFENVVIFGVTQMMPRLESKLSEELVDGAQIAACRFPFPTWQPVQTIGSGIDTVWLYQVPTSFQKSHLSKINSSH